MSSIQGAAQQQARRGGATPSNSVPAAISGTGYTGKTLTAVAGTWSGGSPTGQWRQGGADISGETGLTYVVDAAYNGAEFTYMETVGAVTQVSNSIHNWVPSDEAQVKFWISRAQSTLDVTATLIAQADDLSGYGNHAVQTVADDKPKDDGTFNTSYPAFSLADGTQWFEVTGLATTGYQSFFMTVANNSSANVGLFGTQGSGFSDTFVPLSSDGSSSADILRVDGTTFTAMPDSSVNFDGELLKTTTYTRDTIRDTLGTACIFAAVNLDANPRSPISVGTATTGYTTNGVFSQAIIVDHASVLTDTLVEKITGYLGHHDGITLVAGHTYLTNAPTV